MSDEFAGLKGDFVVLKEEIRSEVTDTITNALDKLYTRIDPLIAEIEDNREDRDVATDQIQKLKTQVNRHERRITKLETPN